MSSDDSDAYEVLRPFPDGRCSKEKNAIRRRSNRSCDHEVQTLEYKGNVVKKIYASIEKALEDCTVLSNTNAKVFEKIKEFCKTSHENVTEKIPLGAVFTGTLVPTCELEPFKLLAEILRKEDYNVALVDATTTKTILDLTKSCGEQFGGELGEIFTEYPVYFPKPPELERPTVLIVEAVEALKWVYFLDLIRMLLSYRPNFRVTLIVGLTTRIEVDQLVPISLRLSFKTERFTLMTPMQCFELALSKTLLSSRCPGMVAGKTVMKFLNDLIVHHPFTLRSYKESIRQALLEHVNTTPMGVLIQFMRKEWMDAETLCTALYGEPFASLPTRDCIRDYAELIPKALANVSGWKTTILWLNIIAEATGSITRDGGGYSLRELYIQALHENMSSTYDPTKVRTWGRSKLNLDVKRKILFRALERMKDVADKFAKTGPQLNEASTTILAFRMNLERLEARTSQSKSHSHSKSKRKKKKDVSKDDESAGFDEICRQVDEVLTNLVSTYLSVPLEEMEGHEIFCLSKDGFMKAAVFASPRTEILNLLRNPTTRPELHDEGHLLKDASSIYNLCRDSEGPDANVFDTFLRFAKYHNVVMPQRISRESQLTQMGAFELESDSENNRVEVDEIRIRFEWAVHALECIGIISTFENGNYKYLRLEIFDD